MNFIPVIVSGGVTIALYALVIFAVLKIFQISGDVSEIKDLLRDIKRNTQDVPRSPYETPSHAPADWESDR